jgi:hypothetical protein
MAKQTTLYYAADKDGEKFLFERRPWKNEKAGEWLNYGSVKNMPVRVSNSVERLLPEVSWFDDEALALTITIPENKKVGIKL